MINATSPNQEGVEGTDSEEVWMITEESAILVISTSLLGTILFFLIKEAYFYARSLLVTSRCAIRGTVSQRQRDWACWTIAITNVPAVLLTLAEAFVLLRWSFQIELLWKLWKMQGLVDEWHTSNEERILCEVSAKLLGLLLQHWLLLLTCWEDPHRSWINVSEIVRDQSVVLAHGFAGRLSLTQAVRLMCEAIVQAAGRSIAGRSDRPSTSRLLLACGQTGFT